MMNRFPKWWEKWRRDSQNEKVNETRQTNAYPDEQRGSYDCLWYQPHNYRQATVACVINNKTSSLLRTRPDKTWNDWHKRRTKFDDTITPRLTRSLTKTSKYVFGKKKKKNGTWKRETIERTLEKYQGFANRSHWNCCAATMTELETRIKVPLKDGQSISETKQCKPAALTTNVCRLSAQEANTNNAVLFNE